MLIEATAISPPHFCRDVLKLIATMFSVSCIRAGDAKKLLSNFCSTL